ARLAVGFVIDRKPGLTKSADDELCDRGIVFDEQRLHVSIISAALPRPRNHEATKTHEDLFYRSTKGHGQRMLGASSCFVSWWPRFGFSGRVSFGVRRAGTGPARSRRRSACPPHAAANRDRGA